ncbi:unnamed protein product [Phytophthora fragariaefolia]|uniref:Unnamed protein product n=1 Tax=Phytophthora fragariaefolia TaxID=1490495 RepID=A0A9W6TL92_9STRA|nr:unnamed protein product [Phytophthora fragariaefolia]
MQRFLKEQQVPLTRPKARSTGDQDVEMESVGTPDQPTTAWEYGPDDLDLGRPARATVATTTATTSNQAINTPRIRVSAMSELKEFAGKYGDEDRARSWFGKAKSAFIRDQAPDQEKCLVFSDRLTGPARNWYRQLFRTTRGTWKDLHQSFQVQYCARGVSVARQYYHARKRSDESPLEYLHRLNVAGLCTRLQIKDSPQEVRREHVEHFIETLDDRDLADQLDLLRIPDADMLEEVLRSRQRAKSRQSKTVYESIKPRQKSPAAAAGTREVRAVHVPEDSSDSDKESRSSSDEDLRRVYLASRSPQDKPQDQRIRDQTQASHQEDRYFSQYPRQTDEGTPSKRCSHCGSLKHDDIGCWRRLTCDKVGWPLPRQQVKMIDDFFERFRKAEQVRESKSPHSAPTFCVKKAQGGWRIVHAYNKLNDATIPTQTPIPRKDKIIDSMDLSTIFSALDLRDGFYQILMGESDIPLTACQQAFDAVNQSLTEAPIMAVVDQDRPFHVMCDASDFAIECALMQHDHEGRDRVVYYQSRQLKPAECNYPVHVKEHLAMKYALEKFRVYLIGKYNFQVEYKPGRLNVVADALSRRPDYAVHKADVNAIGVVRTATRSSSFLDDVRSTYANDADAKQLLDYFAAPSDKSR